MPSPGSKFLSLLCPRLALSTLLLIGSLAGAQNQASCSYSFFPTISSFPSVQLFPSGINDFRTVVGGAFTTSNTAFLRWANGGLVFPKGTSALVDRDDKGVSIGYQGYLNAIILNGATATPIDLTIGSNVYKFLDVEGINKWSSIVGWYTDSNGIAHGFKRWSNGSGFRLNYPAHFTQTNSGTFPTAINDHGTIVGFTQLPFNGFIYRGGEFATLNYPAANGTNVMGISNAGVIIGNASFPNGTATAFLYKDGTFKTISPPNTTGSFVTGMSLKLGVILGVAFSNSAFGGQEGFIATCN